MSRQVAPTSTSSANAPVLRQARPGAPAPARQQFGERAGRAASRPRPRSQSRGRPQEKPDLVKAIYVAKPDLAFESVSTDTKVSIKLEAFNKSGLVAKVTKELLKGGLVDLEKGGKKIDLPPTELPPPLLGEVVRCVMTHLHAAVAASTVGSLALQTPDFGKGEYGECHIEKMEDLKEEIRTLQRRYNVEERKPMKKEAFKDKFGVSISKE